jgi:O-antigen/teichoic acid export membrane protein
VTIIEIIAQVLGLGIMIGWASFDRSVWAIVAGLLMSASVTTVLSFVCLPGTPNRWEWDKAAFGQILRLGKWIFLSSMLSFLAVNGDRLILGGLIGSTLFGIYVIAFNLASSVEQVLGRIISGVGYAALSETARERKENLKANYYRFYSIIAICAYFFSGFLSTYGEGLIRLLYDQRYEAAGWMLEILAVSLLTVPLRLATQSLLIFGVPNVYSHIHAFRLVTLYAGIPVGFYFFGLEGGIWATVVAGLSALPVTIFYAKKYKLYDWWREALLLPVILVGALAGKGFDYLIDPNYFHALLRSLVSLIK